MGQISFAGFLWVLAAGLVAGWPAHSADGPAERPSADFVAVQYVDSTGCVFLRDGKDWRLRRDSGGDPVCGYPPTPQSRPQRQVSPADPPDGALRMPGMDLVEARLLAGVAGAMRPGEFVDVAAAVGGAQPRLSAADTNTGFNGGPPGGDAGLMFEGQNGSDAGPAAAALNVDPEEGSIGRDIALAVHLAPQIDASAAAALHPDRRLCALLGAQPRGPEGLGPTAGDPTRGFCTSPLSPLPGPVYGPALAAPMAQDTPVAVASDRAKPEGKVTRAVAPRPDVRHPEKGPRTGAKTKERAPRQQASNTRPFEGAHPRSPASASADMIPANARWLEIGRYPDRLQADAAARRLAQAGFPLARATAGDGIAILAGPYPGRRQIVTARDQLRRAGFSRVVPR